MKSILHGMAPFAFLMLLTLLTVQTQAMDNNNTQTTGNTQPSQQADTPSSNDSNGNTASNIHTPPVSPPSSPVVPLVSDWSYDNPLTEPSKWGYINSAYLQCAKGRKQSPIDIRIPEAALGHPPALEGTNAAAKARL